MKATAAVVPLLLSCWRACAQDDYWTEVDSKTSLYFFQRNALFINRSLQVDSRFQKFQALGSKEDEDPEESEGTESEDDGSEAKVSEGDEHEAKKSSDDESGGKKADTHGSGSAFSWKKSEDNDSHGDEDWEKPQKSKNARWFEPGLVANASQEHNKVVKDVELKDGQGEAHVETEVMGNDTKTKATVEEGNTKYDVNIDEKVLGPVKSETVTTGTREDEDTKAEFHVNKSVAPDEEVTVVKSTVETDLVGGKKHTTKIKTVQKASTSKQNGSETLDPKATRNGREALGNRNETEKEEKKVKENTSDVSEESKAFARKKIVDSKVTEEITYKNHTLSVTKENATEITEEIIEVAEVNEILSVYLCLFTPLGVAWAVYVHLGSQRKHAMLLLPIMMGCMNVGFDLVNQSLALIMEVPAAITCVQALGMALSMMLWSFFSERERMREVSSQQWLTWLFVAVTYSLYQLSNHLAYEKTSLSERTVFLNLGPIVAIMLEMILLPERLQKVLSFRIKLSLVIMLIGAVLFSIQIPDFTAMGVSVASLLVGTNVAARLAQRAYLGNPDQGNVPIAPLVCMDGMIVFIAAGAASVGEIRILFEHWAEWTQDGSVLLMMILSIITFTGGHFCALHLLQMNSSAVTLLVYQNVVNILDVTFGNVWFHDQAFENASSAIGLSISLICGIWYSVEVVFADYWKQAALNGKQESINEKEGPGLTDSDRSRG